MLNPEIRRNTLLILKEAVNNSLKYADAKNISVKYILTDAELKLEIEDDGVGYETSPPTPLHRREEVGGNGLKNMRKRADEMKAEVEITSSTGAGTKIKLKIPI